ncbi:helix-turn-helix domain-containing protein [Sporolactobacillus sp. KGMB 08714]|uniref:helix-turn-helix domain-containing protein n=1 Tax=Sporolactobacillus sp. KGMB 08714 TaxID=3064704 RepID=UPI002FBE604E
MLTPFGKFCRKLRIDRGELLKDMATKLNVTSAYLSAVENGKRKIPNEWVAKLINKYSLKEKERSDLQFTFEASQTNVNIDLSRSSNSKKNIALAFARKLNGMDDSELQRISKILFDDDKE